MEKNKFKISGFARFYRSLPRFYHGISSAYALKMTYVLYTAVLDAYRRKNPDETVKEKTEAEFYKSVKQADAKPYRTEVQFYRAMEAVYFFIDVSKVKNDQVLSVFELNRMMGDIEIRFYKAFDMEIDDSRTVYSKCEFSLVPRSDEPGVCLLRDWVDTAPA